MAVGPSAEVIQAVEVYDAVQELFEGNLKADVRACLLEFSRRKQDAVERAQTASSATTDQLAKRATVLTLKQDLLDLAQEGLQAFLLESGLHHINIAVEKLRGATRQTSAEWRSLLEEQKNKQSQELQSKQAALDQALSTTADAQQAAAQAEADLNDSRKVLENELQRLKTLGSANASLAQDIQICLDTLHVSAQRSSTPGELPGSAVDKPAQPATEPKPSACCSDLHGSDSHIGTAAAEAPGDKLPDAAAQVQLSTSLKPKPAFKPPALEMEGGAEHPRIRLVAAEDGNLTRGISLSPRAEHSPASPRPFVKDLSKRQLKDLLEDVYLSKARSDARLQKQHQPRETMDQHLVAYLTQKFGLRPLVREWRRTVIAAIGTFQADPEVYLFGRVIRNEIDEEFQLEIGGLRDKAETVVQELMQPSLADWIDPDSTPALVPVDWHAPLAEDTVHVLIGKLTGGNLQLAQQALDMIVQRARLKSSPSRRSFERSQSSRVAPAGTQQLLSVVQAVQIVLIQSHEALLAPVASAFYKIDKFHSGQITAAQFANFCQLLNPSITDQETAALFQSISPDLRLSVTFSSCASMLMAGLKEKEAERIHLSASQTSQEISVPS